MKTEAQILDDIFVKEGDRYAEPPEVDQPTGRGGITLEAYRRFCAVRRAGWVVSVEDLKAFTHEDARQVLGFLLEELADEMGLRWVRYEPLRLHLLDFGYNSGGRLALRWLQRVLGLARTGVMDAGTRDRLAVSEYEASLIHHALLYARLQMVQMLTDDGPADPEKRFEEGWEVRVHGFSLLEVP